MCRFTCCLVFIWNSFWDNVMLTTSNWWYCWNDILGTEVLGIVIVMVVPPLVVEGVDDKWQYQRNNKAND